MAIQFHLLKGQPLYNSKFALEWVGPHQKLIEEKEEEEKCAGCVMLRNGGEFICIANWELDKTAHEKTAKGV